MIKQREMNRRKWLWTAVTVLYMLFIFHNSATVAVESSRQSGGVLALAKECLAGLGVESGWLSEHLIRKTFSGVQPLWGASVELSWDL